MDPTILEKSKKVALHAVKLAGQFLFREFQKKNFHFDHKGKIEIVTSADKKAEKIVLNLIQKNFSDHQILTEESGKINWHSKSPFLWLIDPLDGTTNFSFRHPLFCLSVALAYQQEIILGVIYAPITNELYFVEKGKGVFLNGRKIKVSKRSQLNKAFLTSGYSAREKDRYLILKLYPNLISKSEHHRDLGSCALELAYLAAGRLDGAVILGPRPFDAAAGVLIVQEAGGRVTNFEGKDWMIQDKYLVASNGLIHQGLLKIIRSY
ncbi:MAG: inositol monophosphatase family protein [Patescibacteria group bacterium]